jgi:hypothetical protein
MFINFVPLHKIIKKNSVAGARLVVSQREVAKKSGGSNLFQIVKKPLFLAVVFFKRKAIITQ